MHARAPAIDIGIPSLRRLGDASMRSRVYFAGALALYAERSGKNIPGGFDELLLCIEMARAI